MRISDSTIELIEAADLLAAELAKDKLAGDDEIGLALGMRMASHLISSSREEIARLRQELKRVNTELDGHQRWLSKLSDAVELHGGKRTNPLAAATELLTAFAARPKSGPHLATYIMRLRVLRDSLAEEDPKYATLPIDDNLIDVAGIVIERLLGQLRTAQTEPSDEPSDETVRSWNEVCASEPLGRPFDCEPATEQAAPSRCEPDFVVGGAEVTVIDVGYARITIERVPREG